MKNHMLILIGILLFALPGLFASGKKLETIDSAKIKKKDLFIEHILFWPDANMIRDKKVPLDQIPEDINILKNLLKQVLAPKYCPNDKIVDQNSIAIEECNGPHDNIFIEYDLKEDSLIQVQDLGKALLVSEFPKGEIPFQKDIGVFAEKKAKELLQIGEEKWQKEPKLFISSLDIGKSKFGTITFDPNFPFSDLWYARLTWWSDGKNTSFLIRTSTFDPDWSKENLKNKAGVNAKLSPRKFRKLKKEKETKFAD